MSDTCHFQVRRLGGSVVLLGLLLGTFVDPWFLAISAFAGLNLVQSSFTDTCPAERFLPACGSEADAGVAEPAHD
jgi:hypothetical protein